jgi:hypothetical protein
MITHYLAVAAHHRTILDTAHRYIRYRPGCRVGRLIENKALRAFQLIGWNSLIYNRVEREN